MINRQGYSSWTWWRRLFFSHKGWALWGPASPILVSCAVAAASAPYQVWNSCTLDPEVRLRPHKKSWHPDEHKLAKASTYRGSFTRLVNRKRMVYKDRIENEGFEHREPGQIGWDEAPIPKLD